MQMFLKAGLWAVRAINLVLLVSFVLFLVFSAAIIEHGSVFFKVIGLLFLNWWFITAYAAMTGALIATWRYVDVVKFTQKEGPPGILGGLIGATSLSAFLTLATYGGNVVTLWQVLQVFGGLLIVLLAALITRFTVYHPLKAAYEERHVDELIVSILKTRSFIVCYDGNKLKDLSFDELLVVDELLERYEKASDEQEKLKSQLAEKIGK